MRHQIADCEHLSISAMANKLHYETPDQTSEVKMGDLKLFRINSNPIQELKGSSVGLEKSLQNLIERDLDAFLGVRFLATEYSTGKVHGGRVDTLGIDENGCPVIIEYKRTSDQNVINQGLYYLDWLMDHKGDYKDLVVHKLGPQVADAIDWSAPRLICIATDFTKFDVHAIMQIDRNINLLRYRRYDNDLLLFDLVQKVAAGPVSQADLSEKSGKSSQTYKTVDQILASAPTQITDLFESLKDFCLALGDDVEMRTLKYYYAFRHLKNFASVEVSQKYVCVYLSLDPDTVELKEGFTRDMRNIGHWGPGNLEVNLVSLQDLEIAKPMIIRAYNES